MESQACTLGVDIGGTKVAVVVCDERVNPPRQDAPVRILFGYATGRDHWACWLLTQALTGADDLGAPGDVDAPVTGAVLPGHLAHAGIGTKVIVK